MADPIVRPDEFFANQFRHGNAPAETVWQDFNASKRNKGEKIPAADIEGWDSIIESIEVRYLPTSIWYDGSPLTEDRIDGYIFIERDGYYYQRQIDQQTILKVATIAQLRKLNGFYEGQEITLLGYFESGDKAPLTYKFTCVQGEDDGGSIINSSAGSWKAVFPEMVDIRDFGSGTSFNMRNKVEAASLVAAARKIDLNISHDITLETTCPIHSNIVSTTKSKVKVLNNVGLILSSKDIDYIKGLTYIGDKTQHANNAPIFFTVKNDIPLFENFTISGCDIKDARIWFTLNNGRIKNVKFERNVIDADFTGLDISSVQNDVIWAWGTDYFTFSGNQVRTKNVNRVIKFQASPIDILLVNEKVIIDKNNFHCEGLFVDINTRSKQVIDCYFYTKDVKITNNFIYAKNHSVVFEDKTVEEVGYSKSYKFSGNTVKLENTESVVTIRSNYSLAGKGSENMKYRTHVSIVDNTIEKNGKLFSSANDQLFELYFIDKLTMQDNDVNCLQGTSVGAANIVNFVNIKELSCVNNTFTNCLIITNCSNSYLSVSYSAVWKKGRIAHNIFNSSITGFADVIFNPADTGGFYEVMELEHNVSLSPATYNIMFLIQNSNFGTLRIMHNNCAEGASGVVSTGNVIDNFIGTDNSWDPGFKIDLAETLKYGSVKKAIGMGYIDMADSTDLATAIALVNICKEKINYSLYTEILADQREGDLEEMP